MQKWGTFGQKMREGIPNITGKTQQYHQNKHIATSEGHTKKLAKGLGLLHRQKLFLVVDQIACEQSQEQSMANVSILKKRKRQILVAREKDS